MSRGKWYQKATYLLIALAMALFTGIPFVPRVAASPDQEATFYSRDSDGWLEQSSENYTEAHGASSGHVSHSDLWLYIRQQRVDAYFDVWRSALSFNTSSLPDDACITSATLSLHGKSDGSVDDFEITVVDGSLLNEPLVGTDYGYLRNQTVSGGSFDTSGFNTSGYNDIPLNGIGMGWISKTEITKFGLRSSRDIDAIEPTGPEFVEVFASDRGEGWQPRLVVTYVTPPKAAFVADPLSGPAPLTVNFTDHSTGPPADRQWDFGDGSTSTEQNPSHIYNNAGSYDVSLTVMNACGSNSTIRPNYITVSSSVPPVADFDATPTSGFASLMVNFTDRSTGPHASSSLDFGDGGTSTDQEATFYSRDSDGWLGQTSDNYTEAHGASSGNVSNSDLWLYIGQQRVDVYFDVWRSALFFDTSSLPDDACITSATLSLYGAVDWSDTDFLITVVDGSLLNEPLVGTDYGYLGSQTVSGGTFNTSGFNTSGYNDIPLNGTGMGWISKTGITKFGLRSSKDIDAIEPTGPEFVEVFASDRGEGWQPRLVVTYTIPPPVGGEAYPVSKVSLLAPWIAVGVILAGGISSYVLRRRRAQS